MKETESSIDKNGKGEDSTSVEDRLKNLKQRLRTTLAANHGLTSHPDVLEIIQELGTLNPAASAGVVPPSRSHLLVGEWKTLSSPAFPNRIAPKEGEEDIFQYTLGRISFNIFQPNDLVCTIGEIQNPIAALEWDDDDGDNEHEHESDSSNSASAAPRSIKKMTYPIFFPLTIHTPKGDLDAVMKMDGEAYPSSDDRIAVRFDAGTLCPGSKILSSPEKMGLWKDTFAGAYTKADSERGYIAGFFRYIIEKVMSVTFPSDEAAIANNNTFRYEMKRPPKGFLDIIYLDDEFRITKGNRGSYVVVERT